ncbi:thiamine/thiamine pyrophosphate ABC transporter permease ThiP, partial [Mesorhizobium sp. M1C.F.Ca.ET.212.01.1.1]
LVFMLCITSFTIVLTLGGGPAATTLEVAIYQALRFDFDPARAVVLTLLQIVLTFVVVVALTRIGANTVGDANLPVAPRRYLSASRIESVLNAGLIALALLFVAGPMVATVVSGLQ